MIVPWLLQEQKMLLQVFFAENSKAKAPLPLVIEFSKIVNNS